MQPQDQFERRYEAATIALVAWSETLKDVADVIVERAASYWRLRLDPKASGTCPVEVILHRSQVYDVMIGSESYESLPLDDPDRLQPMLAAIAAGHVVTRTRRSAMTNRLVEIATVIGSANNPLFERARTTGAMPAPSDLVAERHYVPYRRG